MSLPWFCEAIADAAFYNANVITLDAEGSRASAVLVKSGRVLRVGGDELRLLAPPDSRYDLLGHTLLPGFNDAHNHMVSFGLGLSEIDVGYPAIKSIGDITRLVAERVRDAALGSWIIGRGYDENRLIEKAPPSRHDLDKVAPCHPVLLKQNSGHMCVVNSRAMDLCGISAETPDPPGGKIVKDASGEPTGLLQETAQTLVTSKSASNTLALIVAALGRASERYLSEGITSCAEAGVGGLSPHQIKAFMLARADNTLAQRVYMMMSVGVLKRTGASPALYP